MCEFYYRLKRKNKFKRVREISRRKSICNDILWTFIKATFITRVINLFTKIM